MGSDVRQWLLIALALTFSTGAWAADDPRFYGQLSLGAVTAAELRNDNAAATAVFSPKTGWAAEGALGYRVSSVLRVELSLGHRRQGMDGSFARNARIACGAPAIPCLASDVEGGRLTGYSGLVSAKVDIPLDAPVTPYVGGGGGLMRVALRATTTGTLAAGQTQNVVLIDDQDTVAAFRLGAGVSTQVRSATLSLEYAYLTTAKMDLESTSVPVAPFTIHDRIKGHTIGVRASIPF